MTSPLPYRSGSHVRQRPGLRHLRHRGHGNGRAVSGAGRYSGAGGRRAGVEHHLQSQLAHGHRRQREEKRRHGKPTFHSSAHPQRHRRPAGVRRKLNVNIPPAKPNTVKIRKTDSKKAPPSISEEVDGGLYFFLLFPVATARHTVDVPL